MKKLLISAIVLLGLAACGERVPDPSGTYVEDLSGPNVKHIVTYTIEPLDKDSHKYVLTRGGEMMTKVEKEPTITTEKKVFVYAAGSKDKFCLETEVALGMGCFNFDPEKGIRFNNKPEFIKRAD